VCRDTRAVNNEFTDRFIGQVNAAAEAADSGDAVAQAAAFEQVRATFAQWSQRLRTEASAAGSAELTAVLIEYAGAVDAVIARVKSAADLDRLSSFDDTELDTANNRLAQLCGDG
jgi:hypothetical protein